MTAVRRQPRKPARRWLPFRKRTALVWGSALAVAALLAGGLTTAAFVDTEYAKVGTDGVGTGTFSLQVATSTGGPWQKATTPGTAIVIPLGSAASNLVPGGDPVTAVIHVRNNGTYMSSLQHEITATTMPAPTAFLNKLRFTVRAGGGSASPLTPGTAVSLPNLASGAQTTVTVTIALDESAGNDLQGQQVDLLAKVTGQSIPSGGS